MKRLVGLDVYEASVDRLHRLYDEGHRLVVSFSGGKDSTCTLAVTVEAARRAGRLPVEVIMRDEEIMLPGTFEYCERVAARDDVAFHWVYARQPIVNVYNRAAPYFWVFDQLLDPDEWVRQPPAIAYEIPEKHIGGMTHPDRFPPPEGRRLISVIGLRADESHTRLFSVYAAGGHLTNPTPLGVRHSRPIYDWRDGDVWRCIKELDLDYNRAYDTMFRMGVPARRLRIAPPTLNAYGAQDLQLASRAWPEWFARVCKRLPGVRAAAHYGRRACEPRRRAGELWSQAFQRECIDEAPAWIAERAARVRDTYLKQHAGHSTEPLPERHRCPHCSGAKGSWRQLTLYLYNGDPFGLKFKLPYVEPEFFRPGSGVWGGSPTW